MNLEDLKAKLGQLDGEAIRTEESFDEVRRNVMKSRRRFDLRDLREIVACVFVFVMFFPTLFLNMPLLTRLGSLVTCTAAVFIGLSMYLGKQRHRVFPELSVQQFLAAEIVHLDYQIRLLRNVSWWYLAPIAVGYLMFVWGLRPTSEALVASGGYFILDRAIYWLNQHAIRTDLLPQREELVRAYESLCEADDLNLLSETIED